jgi:hypothetical protein
MSNNQLKICLISVLSNLHVKTCSLPYMTMSGMSAIVLACQLAHMAYLAELPK